MQTNIHFTSWNTLLFLPILLITFIPLIYYLYTYKKYIVIKSRTGLTGKEFCIKLMEFLGIETEVVQVNEELADAYDSQNRSIQLSERTLRTGSIASIGIILHETGHLLLHESGQRRNILDTFRKVNKMLTPAFLLLFISQFIYNFWYIDFLLIGVFIVLAISIIAIIRSETAANRIIMQKIEGSGLLHESDITPIRKFLAASALTYATVIPVSIVIE